MTLVTVPVQIDNSMDGVKKDINYGAAPALEIGPVFVNSKSKLRRAIGNFDVSDLQGLTINAAQLERVYSGASGPAFAATIRRCTRPAQWTEDGCTWNKYDGVNDWTDPGGDVDNTTPTPIGYTEPTSYPYPFVTTGFKAFVEDALANRSGIVSLIIRADDEDPGSTRWRAWRSKERANEDIWRLVIDYVSVGQPTMRRWGGSTWPAGAQRIGRGW